ncbi:NAD(P)H-dependent oxidoreductase [Actinomyces sp. zg-332]|uniref:NADPH-dependent FMN reductase n=1 Tax=Actinomyces sp. zg-332 TaxID=2708340 RepID=UPI001421CF72|nr:NADPH-dependent FMN reductase [Actinomyces sp. zg-332]QPK94559.1 NAD(P)H-dependent oxidoreductase [Actinomyces sp. zg-332]
MSKNILFVNGSLRKESFNQKAIDFIKNELEVLGYSTKQVDISQLPFINQDIEFPAPEPVTQIRQELKNSDGLWIVTPEYNHSLPSVLKNFLDWISRSPEQGKMGAPDFIVNKTTAISGVAGGSAASYSIAQTLDVAKFISLSPIDKTVGIILPGEAFTTGKFELSEENKVALKEQIDEFVKAL